MNETLITWNVTNWITVVVMVSLGMVALATVAQVIQNIKGKG